MKHLPLLRAVIELLRLFRGSLTPGSDGSPKVLVSHNGATRGRRVVAVPENGDTRCYEDRYGYCRLPKKCLGMRVAFHDAESDALLRVVTIVDTFMVIEL